MTFDNIFNPKKNKSLIGHENHFFFFKNLILRKRLPKVIEIIMMIKTLIF